MTAWFCKLRRKTVLACAAASLVLIIASILFVEGNLTRIVLSLAQAQARVLAVQTLNEAAAELLSSGEVTYDSLMHVRADENGQVRLIQANTPEMNRLAARVSLLAQARLQEKRDQAVKVPLGSAVEVW